MGDPKVPPCLWLLLPHWADTTPTWASLFSICVVETVGCVLTGSWKDGKQERAVQGQGLEGGRSERGRS